MLININLKLGLHLNTNKTQMRRAKTKPSFNVDVLLRRGKQHLAVWQTFSEQPCYPSTVGISKGICIQYVYIWLIRCLSESRTVYECTIHSAQGLMVNTRSSGKNPERCCCFAPLFGIFERNLCLKKFQIFFNFYLKKIFLLRSFWSVKTSAKEAFF